MKNIRLIQDFIVPALDRKTYGDLLEWDTEPGVFKIKWTHKARSSWKEAQSKVFTAWDELKGRPTPIDPQEFVDSKQRLRAALRNLKTIKDLPGDGQYRRYHISDIEDIRKKNERRVVEINVKTEEPPNIKTEEPSFPNQPRRSRRKIKVEKSMYNDDEDSSNSWTDTKPLRKPRKSSNPRKNSCSKERGLKEIVKCSKSERTATCDKSRPVLESPGLSTLEKSTKQNSEGHRNLEQVSQTKETGAIPKIRTAATIQEKIVKKETVSTLKPKLPRSLACILDSQNINYDRHIAPRRTTKVSQEVWASSLEIKQEEPKVNMDLPKSGYLGTPHCSKKQIFASSEKSKECVPVPKAPAKTKKKSKACVPTTQVSASSKKTSKNSFSTTEPTLKIKLPVKQEKIENHVENLEARAQCSGGARPRDKKQKPVANIQRRQPVANDEQEIVEVVAQRRHPIAHNEQEEVQVIAQRKQPAARKTFSGNIDSFYSEAYMATRFDEDYLEKAWLENDKECPWFCGKGSSDVVFDITFPDYNAPMYALGVRLDALEKLSGFIE